MQNDPAPLDRDSVVGPTATPPKSGPVIEVQEMDLVGSNRHALLPTEGWHSFDEPVYMPETVGLYKFARENGVDFEIVQGVKRADLRDDNLWMPVVYIAGSVMLPVVLGVISNYVYDKFKSDRAKADRCKLHMEIRAPGKKGKVKSVKYEGPVSGLGEITKVYADD